MLPKRGEIWLVNLDPTVGAEIQKTRPAIIISSDYQVIHTLSKLPFTDRNCRILSAKTKTQAQ